MVRTLVGVHTHAHTYIHYNLININRVTDNVTLEEIHINDR